MQSSTGVEPAGSAGIAALPVTGSLRLAFHLSAWIVALLTIASAAGLLRGRQGLYPSDPLLLPQFLGQDAITLVVAIPLLLTSMWMTRQGSLRGLILWMGMLFYIAYSYYFYIVGVQFGPLFLVHVALVAASVFALLTLLAGIAPERVQRRFRPELPVRLIGGFLVATGTLFIVMWIGDILRRLHTGESPDPVAHAVYGIDLVIALPATVGAGIALWRRAPWGFTLAGLLLVKVTALMVTLLVNTALVLRGGQPADPGQVAAFGVTAVAALAVIGVYLRAVGPAADGATRIVTADGIAERLDMSRDQIQESHLDHIGRMRFSCGDRVQP